MKRPIVCDHLNSTNRRGYLNWCTDNSDTCMNQWTTFTAELRFTITSDSRRTLIWREQGTPYLPFNVREIDHYDNGRYASRGRPHTLLCL
ncbi:transposable element Tcb2 transposase [Trichonephila clavipes]|nr:transposable element Tcb2 transposase [Trichonephila clavipes]